MLAPAQSLTFDSGQDLTINGTVYTDATWLTAQPITGYSLSLVVKAALNGRGTIPTGPALIQVTNTGTSVPSGAGSITIVNALAGIFSATVTRAAMLTLPPGNYVWDVFRIDGGNYYPLISPSTLIVIQGNQ